MCLIGGWISLFSVWNVGSAHFHLSSVRYVFYVFLECFQFLLVLFLLFGSSVLVLVHHQVFCILGVFFSGEFIFLPLFAFWGGGFTSFSVCFVCLK